MALWQAFGQGPIETTGITATTALPITVTASATPHTKGSWTTLVASTSFTVTELIVLAASAVAVGTTDTSMLVDLGVGGAGSERVVVPDLMRGWMGISSVRIPIRIPSGERIAARIQGAVASDTFDAHLIMSGRGSWEPIMPVGSVATNYGTNSATSNGTALTDTGSANTKAAWTEITASTTRPIRWLIPQFALPAADTNISGQRWLIDIGVGAAGSEAVLASNIGAQPLSTEEVLYSAVPALAANLPSGVRLAARFQKSSAGGEPPSVALLGID